MRQRAGAIMGGAASSAAPAVAATGSRLLLLLGFALALGACSKCDIPDLGRWGPPAPHVCHDDPPPQ
jgi:hypothetical protein